MKKQIEIRVYNSLYTKEQILRNSGHPLFDNNDINRSLEFKKMSKPITNVDKFDPIMHNYKKLDTDSINSNKKKVDEPIFQESCSQPQMTTPKFKTSINLESSSNSANDFDSDERSDFERAIREDENEKQRIGKDTNKIVYDSDYNDDDEEDELKTRLTDKQLIPTERPRPEKYNDPDTDSSSGSEYIKPASPEGQKEEDLEELFLKGGLDDEEEYLDDKKLSFTDEFDKLVLKINNIIDLNQHYLPWSSKHLGNGFFSAKTRTILTNQIGLLSKLMALQIKCKGKNEWTKICNKYNEIILTCPEITYDIQEDLSGHKFRVKNIESVNKRESELNQKIRDLAKGYKEKSYKDKSSRNKNYYDIFKIVDEIYIESQFNDENYGFSLKDITEKTEKTVNPDEFTIGPFIEIVLDLFSAPNTIIKDFSETDMAIFTDHNIIPYCIFTGKKINIGDSVKQIRLIKNDIERSKDWGIDKYPNRPYTKEILLKSLKFFYVLSNATINTSDYNIFKLTCNSLINLTLSNPKEVKTTTTMDSRTKPTRKKTPPIPASTTLNISTKKTKQTKKKEEPKEEEEKKVKQPINSKKRKSPPDDSGDDDDLERSQPKPNKQPKINNDDRKKNMSLGSLLDSINEDSSENDDDDNNDDKMDLNYSIKLSINILNKPYLIKYSEHYYLHICPLWNKLNLMNSLLIKRDNKKRNYSTIDFKMIKDPDLCAESFKNYASKLRKIKNEFITYNRKFLLTGVFEVLNLLFIRISDPPINSPIKDDANLVKKQYNIEFNDSPLIIDYFFEQLGPQLNNSKVSYLTKYIDKETHELKENLFEIPFIKLHNNLILDLFDYLFPPV